jgi:tetratricopeptide (TPR) repeat protein
MADQGRLDELKRKFDENPKRYFAPLANEYRKAGDPERAIELCRTYLPQQPTHMSGYIVYGQALHDAGQSDESAAVFKQALTLDPENIIALRQLGDIACGTGDTAGAARWYGKVLELDPRNEEVAAFVASTSEPGSAAVRPSPERPAPPAIRPEPEHDEAAVRLEDIVSAPDVEQSRIIAQEERIPAGESSGDGQPGSDKADIAFGVPESPKSSAADRVEVAEYFDETELADVVEPAISATVLEGPWHSEAVESDEPSAPLRLSDFLIEEDAAFAPTAEELGESPEGPTVAAAAPAVASGSESVFVTETMAELYVKQGLPEEALGIYRQLAARRDDPALHRRIAEIEGGQHAATGSKETVRDFFARIGARRPTERVELAVDRNSPLVALFGSSAPAAGDLDAAQRLSSAFGNPRSGNPRS